MRQGPDVSYYQGELDRKALLENPPDFFLFRSGDGMKVSNQSILDPQFERNLDIAQELEQKHGTPWGGYHYRRAWYPGEDEAGLVLEGLDGARPPLGWWSDVEIGTWKDLLHGGYISSQLVLERTMAFVHALEDAGVKTGHYGYWGYDALFNGRKDPELEPADGAEDLLANPLWVVDYTTRAGKPPRVVRNGWKPEEVVMHQFTSEGSCVGVETPCDINVEGPRFDTWLVRDWVPEVPEVPPVDLVVSGATFDPASKTMTIHFDEK